MPPWQCTIAFGSPVVRTRRARRAGGRRNGVERELPALGEEIVPGDRVWKRIVLPAAYGTWTTASTLGSLLRTSATCSRRSTCFSPYR
jgi:hypothetical protein